MLKYNPNINLILNSQSVDINKTIVIEELSELQKELCKDLRGYDRREEIKEEMADVYICLQLLKQIYNFSDEDLEKMYERKMRRNIERIKEWFYGIGLAILIFVSFYYGIIHPKNKKWEEKLWIIEEIF